MGSRRQPGGVAEAYRHSGSKSSTFQGESRKKRGPFDHIPNTGRRFRRWSYFMFLRAKSFVISILFLLAVGAITPAANAQLRCGTEYDLSQRALRAAALPQGLSRRMQVKLIN